MSRIEYNPSLNDKVAGQLGDLGVEIQIPIGSIKNLIMPYKVYTALVSQTGTDEFLNVDTGLLTIGVTYIIDNFSPGMDFTNVGAPNNNVATYFVATGTTPASWGSNEDTGNATLGYNLGAPVVKVLENTIGNIWFTYDYAGSYLINSNGLFTVNKSISLNDQTGCINIATDQFYNIYIFSAEPNSMEIAIFDETITRVNDMLTSKPIEIRVYN